MVPAEQITEHAFGAIATSPFFRELCAGAVPRQALNHIFGQYYFWQEAVHRYLIGLYADRLHPLDRQGDVTTAVLCAKLRKKRYKRFLASLGIEPQEPGLKAPMAAYLEAFRIRSRDMNLLQLWAALAGSQLVYSLVQHTFRIALHSQYGVTNAGEIEDEDAHFLRMWATPARLGTESALVSAAADEIERNIGLWDELRNYIVSQAA